MSRNIKLLSDLLEEILREGIKDESDFFDLAATGELLRRTILIEEDPPKDAVELVEKYDEFLKKEKFELNFTPVQVLDAALKNLEDFAKKTVYERYEEEYEDLLDSIEDALAMVASAARAGIIKEREVDELGQMARKRARSIAHELVELWDYAEERYEAASDDPDFPGLYSYLEELIVYSSFQQELRDLFRSM